MKQCRNILYLSKSSNKTNLSDAIFLNQIWYRQISISSRQDQPPCIVYVMHVCT